MMSSPVTAIRGKNVLGTALHPCCFEPKTGFYRDGFCRTDEHDFGKHTVCAVMTQEFLDFSRSRGNDLTVPNPEGLFPGLKAGDKWCVCVERWQEAFVAGFAPRVVLESTHEEALEVVQLSNLKMSVLQ